MPNVLTTIIGMLGRMMRRRKTDTGRGSSSFELAATYRSNVTHWTHEELVRRHAEAERETKELVISQLHKLSSDEQRRLFALDHAWLTTLEIVRRQRDDATKDLLAVVTAMVGSDVPVSQDN